MEDMLFTVIGIAAIMVVLALLMAWGVVSLWLLAKIVLFIVGG